MEAVITDKNIKEYVRSYLTGKKWDLPVPLRDIKIGDWDVSNVTDMRNLFHFEIEYISDGFTYNGYGTSNINDKLYYSLFNEPLNWNVSKVEYMTNMFRDCGSFNQDLSNWDVSNVKDMCGMFYGCRWFNSPLHTWKIFNVRGMVYMFADCIRFNRDLSSWDVSNVKDMFHMFQGCTEFNQDLSSWDVSKVENLQGVFEGCNIKGNNLEKTISIWIQKINEVREKKIKDLNEVFIPKGWSTAKNRDDEGGGGVGGGNRKIRGRRSKKGKRRGRKATQKRNKKV